jgi:ADP-heptose:LPS heptosyltransferase
LLRAQSPGLRFVQLGSRTSEPLLSVDVDLVGRTTLPEAAAIIASSILHIDNEGGLVHLARSLGVVSVVVFGPTPAAYFGYPANINIEPPFCGGCWWINQTWMDHCPRGFVEARCMSEQSPESVATRATTYLQANALVARRQLASRQSEEGSVGGYSGGRS